MLTQQFDIAEHTGNILFTEALEGHPMRTTDPAAANFFVVATSPLRGPEPGRNKWLAAALLGEPRFQHSGGGDHVVHAGHWSCGKDPHLLPLLENATVVSADTKWCCGAQPNRVVVGPYVPHAELLRWRMQPRSPESRGGREHLLFFQGHMHRRVDAGSLPRMVAVRKLRQVMPSSEEFFAFDSALALRRDAVPADAAEVATRREMIAAYARNILKSKFCLVLHGDSATSRRLFDALAAGCVPVVINDHLATKGNLPLFPWLPWGRVAVFVPEQYLVSKAACVAEALRAMPSRQYRDLLRHGEAAWRELAYCTAGNSQQHCARRGRAAENLLAVARLAVRNSTAYAEATRPPFDRVPWHPSIRDHCGPASGALQRTSKRYMAEGLQLESHACARPAPDRPLYMSTRVGCVCPRRAAASEMP